MILVAEAALGAEEIAALTKVVESGWITMGDRVRAFEQAFAVHHGASDASATNIISSPRNPGLAAAYSGFWSRRALDSTCANSLRNAYSALP